MGEKQRRGPTAKIRDPERKREWEAILDSDTLPIKSPIPTWVDLPDMPHKLVYELDLKRLKTEHLERLVDHLARKFDLTPEAVTTQLMAEGVPILVEDVLVTGYDGGLFL